MKNPSAEVNLQFLSGGAMERAKNSCVEVLRYRLVNHVQKVKETEGGNNIWRLVLRDCREYSKATILCSGRGEITEDVSNLVKLSESRFSDDLVLVKSQKESRDIYYVLSDCGKKNEVINASSVEELECHGKILFISNGQDPPESISCEILKSYFGNYKKSCSNLDECYIRIVENTDEEKLRKEILDKGAIKCAIDKNGWTLLHHAVHHTNLKILHFLISVVGINVNAQDNICKRKPVIIAAREGYKDIIRFFVDKSKSFNVNEADSIGWTLLHYAAWKGNLEAVRLLIDTGAKIDAQDLCLGKTPIYVAVEEGHLDVVAFLLRMGKGIEETTFQMKNLVHPAAFKGFLDILKILPNNLFKYKDNNGWNPLHHAASGGQLVIVIYLVYKKQIYLGSSLNSTDDLGWTPLHHAVKGGHYSIVGWLVNEGAALNSSDNLGWTPLHHAVSEGHLKIVECLVNKGADLNSTDNYYWTPLHHAVKGVHFNIIEFLAGRGADLNSIDKYGCTPLHEAVRLGRIQIVQFLVANGVNFNDVLTCGCAPFHEAVRKEHTEIVQEAVEDAKENINENEAAAENTKTNAYTQIEAAQQDVALIPEQNEVVEDAKKNTNENEAAAENTKTNASTQIEAAQQDVALIPEQNEVVEDAKKNINENVAAAENTKTNAYTQIEAAQQDVAVKENINENEAAVGNSKTNAFTQTEAADCQKRFECKASLFFRKVGVIYVGIFFWLILAIICLHSISHQ